jgi:adenylate cyclase
VVCAALGALYLGWVIDRFTQASWCWPTVVPVGMQIPMALFASLGFRLGGMRQEREAIRQAFGHFLPGSVVDQLAQGLGPVTQGNRVVYGSCLATDAANYTALAEQMDPARLAELMNDYFAQLFVPVERSGGVVVDVVGDAMVAIWVAPSSSAALRRNACEAALEIVQAVERFSLPLPDRPGLPTRLALHAGDMLVGNIGASRHYEYRAVGDIVNTASRLQGLNKVLGTRLLATSVTVQGLDDLVVRRLGSFVLAGKAAALTVVELMGRQGQASAACRLLCQRFEVALACHDAGDWSGAAEQFASLLQAAPDDGPSRFYLDRCHALMQAPMPATWHPTIVIDTK